MSTSRRISFTAKPNIKKSRNVIASENESVQIECSCSNCLPLHKSEWNYKNKKTRRHVITKFVDEENDFFKLTLTISKIDVRQDEGAYECELLNSDGRDKKKVNIATQVKPKDLKISMKGKFLKEIKSVAVIRDFRDHTLTCIGLASPIPKIVWFKNGQKVGMNSITLSQNDVEGPDGDYQCTATNSLGTASKIIRVSVEIPPLTDSKENQIIVVGKDENVVLKCDVTGSPDPTIKWTFDSRPLKPSKKLNLSQQNKILEFKSSIDRLGTFTCTAQNKFGKLSMDFTIFYKGPPNIINSGDVDVKQNVGDNLKLTCEATGYPQVSNF